MISNNKCNIGRGESAIYQRLHTNDQSLQSQNIQCEFMQIVYMTQRSYEFMQHAELTNRADCIILCFELFMILIHKHIYD